MGQGYENYEHIYIPIYICDCHQTQKMPMEAAIKNDMSLANMRIQSSTKQKKKKKILKQLK